MTNSEVYKYSKTLVDMLKFYDIPEEQFKVYRTLRDVNRKMVNKDLITPTQRDYLAGVMMKVVAKSTRHKNYYILTKRRYI